jgi:hypothetical protein
MENSKIMDQVVEEMDLQVLKEGIAKIQAGISVLELWVIGLKRKNSEERAPLLVYLERGEAMQSYGSMTQVLLKHGLDSEWELTLRSMDLEVSG